MNALWDDFSWPEFGARLLALAVSITIHEFAHAWTAYRAGDDTAKLKGRLSLNPIDHYDPIGSTMMILFGFGWAKPVPVNPYRFRSPRWDNVRVSAAGPVSNLVLATIIGLLLRFNVFPSDMGEVGMLVVLTMLLMNVGLAFFNLIPIPPLDGSHILSGLLPTEQARQYDRIMGQYGFLILLGLLFIVPSMLHVDILGPLIWVPGKLFLKLVIGF